MALSILLYYLFITDVFALLYLSLPEALLMYFVSLESKAHNDRGLICLFVTLSPVPLWFLACSQCSANPCRINRWEDSILIIGMHCWELGSFITKSALLSESLNFFVPWLPQSSNGDEDVYFME